MAARPNPHRALRLCVHLARNSVRRLESSVESTQNVLDTNVRLTSAERDSYRQALAVAEELLSLFGKISAVVMPKPARAPAQRRIGRPSKEEVARGEALRRKEQTKRKKRG